MAGRQTPMNFLLSTDSMGWHYFRCRMMDQAAARIVSIHPDLAA
jgi:hypothetical protein